MIKAGDYLSIIFDANTQEKAKTSSKLLIAWQQLAKNYGIASAAFHSKIINVQRGILQIEAEHPGWVQILQTKVNPILSDLQKMFPELALTGISFRLGKPSSASVDACEHSSGNNTGDNSTDEDFPMKSDYLSKEGPVNKLSGYDKIKDKALLDSLKSLEETLKRKQGKKK